MKLIKIDSIDYDAASWFYLMLDLSDYFNNILVASAIYCNPNLQ